MFSYLYNYHQLSPVNTNTLLIMDRIIVRCNVIYDSCVVHWYMCFGSPVVNASAARLSAMNSDTECTGVSNHCYIYHCV